SQEDDLDSDDEPDVLIIQSTHTLVVPIVDEATTQNDDCGLTTVAATVPAETETPAGMTSSAETTLPPESASDSESDADSGGKVVSADDVIPAGVSVSAGIVAATVVSPQSETEFALMGLSTKMVYGKKATDSSKIKTTDDSITYTNDSVPFDFSDRSSEPSTNDLKMCDSSVECSRPNHSDHDSTSSVSAPTRQQNIVFVGQPNQVSTGQQNTVSASPPNPVYAGHPNPVYAGDGILGP
nr:hypothetical protein [Tanacetum cinerariifolium]